jgi:biopolymer transport protein TolR
MVVGFSGSTGGIVSDVNVVPLIDILLVLLVIFMIIPHPQMGLQASLPEQVSGPVPLDPLQAIVVQIASDGSVRINGSVVQLDELRGRLGRNFVLRGHRAAFLQGDGSLKFQVVAEVLDVMQVAGASPVGLMTSELEKNR